MTQKLTISPVTRINGLWSIEVWIDQGKIIEAQSSGSYFRGLELILLGRDPRDAVYLTQRICGICSSAHALVSSLAFEDAFDLEIPPNAMLIRNLIFAADLLQNHLRQFYVLTIPDYAKLPDQPPFAPQYKKGYKLPKTVNDKLVNDYITSFDYHRIAHEMLTVFGGKAPHNHGILIGGVSAQPTIDKIRLFKGMLDRVSDFVENIFLSDIDLVAQYYPEYFSIGQGYNNMITFGMFPDPSKNDQYISNPGIRIGDKMKNIEPQKITEEVKYSWYKNEHKENPVLGKTDPNFNKSNAYTWVKSPRYDGLPCETGPLGRLIISKEYPLKISAMDRKKARALEAFKVSKMMKDWLQELEPDKPVFEKYEIPKEGEGAGMAEVMRGALGHWVRIEKHKISHYQIITPSAWNCSPKDNTGKRGPIEQALIGTPIDDIQNPIEIGRVLRSFDPCLSCAVHLLQGNRKIKQYQVL